MSAKDYPDHLNPFDDNYTGTSLRRQKYNTWSHRVRTSTLLEKPWVALNVSPKGKLVRRLSVLKSAIEQFAIRKKLIHSSSFSEGERPPRSHNAHDDFSFRIISPKLKEKIRQQAFSQSINTQEQQEADSHQHSLNSLEFNGPLSPEIGDSSKPVPASLESDKGLHAGAKPKARKKGPPPPPPTDSWKTNISMNSEKTDDSHSTNSSITQDLERDGTSDEENSKIDVIEIKSQRD